MKTTLRRVFGPVYLLAALPVAAHDAPIHVHGTTGAVLDLACVVAVVLGSLLLMRRFRRRSMLPAQALDGPGSAPRSEGRFDSR